MPLNTPPAKILARWLIAQDFFSLAGDWPIYVSSLPASPDLAASIYDLPGVPDGRIMTTGERIEHPRIQIKLRALTYPVGWTKLKDVEAALNSILRSEIAIVGDQTYSIQSARTGNPFHIGYEPKNRRPLFTINSRLTINPV